MARQSNIDRLPQEQQRAVDRVIRAHRHFGLDEILDTLKSEGVVVPRSTLGRYVLKLRSRDALCSQPDEGTIVTIVERGTGEVRVVRTAAAGAAIAALIEAI